MKRRIIVSHSGGLRHDDRLSHPCKPLACKRRLRLGQVYGRSRQGLAPRRDVDGLEESAAVVEGGARDDVIAVDDRRDEGAGAHGGGQVSAGRCGEGEAAEIGNANVLFQQQGRQCGLGRIEAHSRGVDGLLPT